MLSIEQKISNLRTYLDNNDKYNSGTIQFTELDKYLEFLIKKNVAEPIIKVKAIFEDYQILNTDSVILVDGSGPIDVTMPNPEEVYDSSTNYSRIITINDIGTGTVDIVAYDGEDLPLTQLNSTETVDFFTNGIDWFVK